SVEPERREARRPQSFTDGDTRDPRPMARQRATPAPPNRANEPSPCVPSPGFVRTNPETARTNPGNRQNEARKSGEGDEEADSGPAARSGDRRTSGQGRSDAERAKADVAGRDGNAARSRSAQTADSPDRAFDGRIRPGFARVGAAD